MRTVSKVIVIILLICAFAYGFMVGLYKIFPFSQILGLRNSVFDVVGVEYGPKEEVVLLAEPVEVMDTALHRLFVKKVHINYNKDITRSGAMTNHEYDVFINPNYDTKDKGLIMAYDMENHQQYQMDSLEVPLNYEQLLSSNLVELEAFDLFRFRVSGMYIDVNADDSYTLFAAHHFYEKDENCISFNISKTDLSKSGNVISQESGWETIYTATPCIYPEENTHFSSPFPGHMESGSIIEYDDNTLLISVGTFSTDPEQFGSLPMDRSSSFGKFHLVDKTTGESSIYAIGIRNAQGIVRDSEGTIWATDQGPMGGDELNIVEEGRNYGWPMVTYGINYGIREWPFAEEQGRHPNYDKPAYVWLPSVATSCIIQIRGDKYPLWDGDLLVGSLGGGLLNRIRVDENNRVVYNERIYMAERIRDLLMLPDGKIVLLTDDSSLVIIEDGGPVYEEISEEHEVRRASLNLFDKLVEDMDQAEVQRGALTARSIYAQRCSACHYLTETNSVGPHLKNLFDREVGGLPDFNYSHSLAESDEEWSADLLKSFLLNPDNTFPNTNMIQVSLTPAEADSIASFLANQ